MVQLNKFHVLISLAALLAGPLVSGLSAFYKSEASFNERLAESKLERERDFVRKSELEKVDVKLTQIADDVSQIKGYLKPKAR